MNAEILANPRAERPSEKLLNFIQAERKLDSHILFQSSGSMGRAKWVALSRAALESSADACNQHLDATSSDVFLLAIPNFHVGGFGLRERARVAGARCEALPRWQAESFCESVRELKATLSSLVPAQLYDLVKGGHSSPRSMRAIVVGGGAVPESLYREARKLGWPILTSYGLTECSSQVATSTLSSLKEEKFPEAVLLPHILAKQVDAEKVSISSPSLLSFYVVETEEEVHLVDPKEDGAFLLPDRVNICGNSLKTFGRWEEDYKVLGEWIRWDYLKKLFYELSFKEGSFLKWELALFPDERRGNLIAILCENFGESAKGCVETFNSSVFPFERITHLYEGVVPRTALGKILPRKINPICLKEISR